MKIEIISKAHADTDYSIGYVDGCPSVMVLDETAGYEGEVGYAYRMDADKFVHNMWEGYNWYLDEHGRWESAHETSPRPDGLERFDAFDDEPFVLYSADDS